MSGEERDAPTLAELAAVVSRLPIGHAQEILARARPAPAAPPPETGKPLPPRYTSWGDFLARTTPAERRRWCAKKASVANRSRLMSGRPAEKIIADDVRAVLGNARGRCAHCGSLAAEPRPSKPNGTPAPWEAVGRRIGSLGHLVSRFQGGANARENLVWSCLWCNTWPSERRRGATDHGGYFPGAP